MELDNMMITKLIAERVKEAREEAKLSQEELAKFLGYSSPNPIYKLEAGQSAKVDVSDLLKISSILKKPFSFFIDQDTFTIPQTSPESKILYSVEELKKDIQFISENIGRFGTASPDFCTILLFSKVKYVKEEVLFDSPVGKISVEKELEDCKALVVENIAINVKDLLPKDIIILRLQNSAKVGDMVLIHADSKFAISKARLFHRKILIDIPGKPSGEHSVDVIGKIVETRRKM